VIIITDDEVHHTSAADGCIYIYIYMTLLPESVIVDVGDTFRDYFSGDSSTFRSGPPKVSKGELLEIVET